MKDIPLQLDVVNAQAEQARLMLGSMCATFKAQFGGTAPTEVLLALKKFEDSFGEFADKLFAWSQQGKVQQ